ncbi:hypothetical protein M5K25_027744 [Dendrobium thyrsiflorum]|uniref:RING-type E3 ubiquitin transferase n=1 Tax=Dendrobium thyrsiflorum TaxID=117978 RepID=A0ABD0TUK9_DENTH
MCGDMEIKFPFTLESSSNSCRKAGLSANLSCSSTNETIITLPSSESYRVTSIDFFHGIVIEVLPSTSSISCPWRNGIQKRPNVNGSIFNVAVSRVVLVNCTTKLSLQADNDDIVGPISCLSELGSFVYALGENERMDILPPSCIVIYIGEVLSDLDGQPIQTIAQKSVQGQTATLYPNLDENIQACYLCSDEGKKCGYNIRRDITFCFSQDSHHGSHLIVEGVAIGTSLVVFLIAALVVLFFFKKYRNEKQKRIKWNPAERPPMSKVVQMLTTNFQNMEMPPTPFVPSSNQPGNVNVTSNHEEILEVCISTNHEEILED